jgi:hypothetical protein
MASQVQGMEIMRLKKAHLDGSSIAFRNLVIEMLCLAVFKRAIDVLP